MKSTDGQLRKRGMAEEADIRALSQMPTADLLGLLVSGEPHIRSAAAINLCDCVDRVSSQLLLQLSRESCLYTRIAIGESLQEGSLITARKMADYLGRIGNNQHRVLPERVSAKKTFPLPRDIIARYMGRMDPAVFPFILEVLGSEDTVKIYEALDAAGDMVFRNPVLGNQEHCEFLISLVFRHEADVMVRWKVILCLSVFPCRNARIFLRSHIDDGSVIGLEARRSLAWIGE